MSKIILSYRRSDSAWTARSIFDRLSAHYGKESVFMDVDNIPFGIDFRDHIHVALHACDILIVVVGPKWLGPRVDAPNRIHDENDPVRIEVETALNRGIPVIPVLVDGSHMPSADELPQSLKDFSYRNAAELDAGRDFHQQIDRLIRSMDRILETGSHATTDPASDQARRATDTTDAVSVAPADPPATLATELAAGSRAGDATSRLPLLLVAGVAVLLVLGAAAAFLGLREVACSDLGLLCTATDLKPAAPASTPIADAPAATTPATQSPISAAPTSAGKSSSEAPSSSGSRPLRPHAPAESCASATTGVRYCASSVLPPQGTNHYVVQNLFSDDNDTAWVAGSPGYAVGEWVLVEFDRPRQLRRITIKNGYQKNPDTYRKNSRPRAIRLVFSSREAVPATLTDTMGSQVVSFGQPIEAQWVQLVIESVYAGSKYSDTAISKLAVE